MAVPQAIAARCCTTLKSLRLHIAPTTTAAANAAVALLTMLGEMRVPLEELHVYCREGDPNDSAEKVTALTQALESILQSTTALNRLTLGSFHFDKTSIHHLVAGLSANRTVTALAFVQRCGWCSHAARAFVDYTQCPVEKSNEPLVQLNELHVSHFSAFDGFTMFKVLDGIFTVPPPNTYCTIGSSVQTLSRLQANVFPN
jgi:hypothetical protein